MTDSSATFFRSVRAALFAVFLVCPGFFIKRVVNYARVMAIRLWLNLFSFGERASRLSPDKTSSRVGLGTVKPSVLFFASFLFRGANSDEFSLARFSLLNFFSRFKIRSFRAYCALFRYDFFFTIMRYCHENLIDSSRIIRIPL